jgi:hypothetical protein
VVDVHVHICACLALGGIGIDRICGILIVVGMCEYDGILGPMHTRDMSVGRR